jgi:hypothetical protein
MRILIRGCAAILEISTDKGCPGHGDADRCAHQDTPEHGLDSPRDYFQVDVARGLEVPSRAERKLPPRASDRRPCLALAQPARSRYGWPGLSGVFAG